MGVNDSPSSDASSNRDEVLSLLLSELSDRVSKGEVVNIEAVTQQYPDLAAELKELWGAVMIANAVGGDVADDLSSPDDETDITAAMELPCRIGDVCPIA